MAGGFDASRSRSFASRIVDWRDADDQPGTGGAELADYRRANIGYGPRNGPFEAVGELRQVLGLADLGADVLDAFTVYSTRSPTISVSWAQPLVRRALTLPSLSSEVQSQQVERSGMRVDADAPEIQLMIGQAVRVHACVQQDAIALCRVAIARLTGHRTKPFQIYAWYTEAP
jgi:type II secretory pathway component PulK